VRSGLFWSPDGRKVAFVEEQRRVFWLVVLDVDVKDSEVKAIPRRFKLAEKVAEVTGVEWARDEQAVKVVTQRGSFLVELNIG